MSSTEGSPTRRRRARRAADTPRVPELDALLREVDALRLTLETDLSLAAAAVEAGEAELARDVLDADQDAVRNFEAKALGHLDALADQDERVPHRRVWAPTRAASFVAAAALVGLLAGVLPQAISNRSTGPTTSAAATDSLERLQELVLTGDASQIRAASVELHEQLASVVAVARTDPAAAQNALLLLSYEQTVLSRSADRSELVDVLRQSQALARAIRAALPASVRSIVPTAPQLPARTSGSSKPQPSTASPKPSPTPTRKATTTASASPQPSSSPSPSGNPYQLPQPPLSP